MRDFKGNYIIIWREAENAEDDFHRLKGVTVETVKREALKLYRGCPLYKRYKTLEIWQADADCYREVGNHPLTVVNMADLDMLYV